MSSILTVRLDDEVKRRALEILKSKGQTPSSVVQKLFDYVVKNDALPFDEEGKPSRQEIFRRIAAFDECHTKHPLPLDDNALKADRLKARYGFDA